MSRHGPACVGPGRVARDLVGGAGEAVALVHLRPARRQASGPAGAATAKNDHFGDLTPGSNLLSPARSLYIDLHIDLYIACITLYITLYITYSP